MKYRAVIFILLLFACSSEQNKKEVSTLSRKQIQIVDDFAVELINSINDYRYDVIKTAWDDQLFRDRIGKLHGTDKTLLNQFFDEEFSNYLLNLNMDMVNKLKINNGKAYLLRSTPYPQHVEVTFALLYGRSIEFWKYCVEIKNNTPRLTDLFAYRDEIWQRENIKNNIQLNSKYTAKSPERYRTNHNLLASKRALNRGDTLLALDYLYEIPKTHFMGNWLSLKKIDLASQLADSIFATVLFTEQQLNNSVYINYLNSYFFYDSLLFEQSLKELNDDLGPNVFIDSLKSRKFMWN